MLDLASYNECTGCSACINICSKKCLIMKADEYGFLYPSLQHPDLCVKCGMCGKVCPVSPNKKNARKRRQQKHTLYIQRMFLSGKQAPPVVFFLSWLLKY